MPRDQILYLRATTPTSGIAYCPCGMEFFVDSLAEYNLVFDTERKRLRAVCPRCGRIEDPSPFWNGAKSGSIDPQPNRIKDLL